MLNLYKMREVQSLMEIQEQIKVTLHEVLHLFVRKNFTIPISKLSNLTPSLLDLKNQGFDLKQLFF